MGWITIDQVEGGGLRSFTTRTVSEPSWRVGFVATPPIPNRGHDCGLKPADSRNGNAQSFAPVIVGEQRPIRVRGTLRMASDHVPRGENGMGLLDVTNDRCQALQSLDPLFD